MLFSIPVIKLAMSVTHPWRVHTWRVRDLEWKNGEQRAKTEQYLTTHLHLIEFEWISLFRMHRSIKSSEIPGSQKPLQQSTTIIARASTYSDRNYCFTLRFRGTFSFTLRRIYQVEIPGSKLTLGPCYTNPHRGTTGVDGTTPTGLCLCYNVSKRFHLY